MSGSSARANPASNRDSGFSAAADQGGDGLAIAERGRGGDRAVADLEPPGRSTERRECAVLTSRRSPARFLSLTIATSASTAAARTVGRRALERLAAAA